MMHSDFITVIYDKSYLYIYICIYIPIRVIVVIGSPNWEYITNPLNQL